MDITKKKASRLGKIGYLIKIVQRGKDKVQDLWEGSCIPSWLVCLTRVEPFRLRIGFSYILFELCWVLTSHTC